MSDEYEDELVTDVRAFERMGYVNPFNDLFEGFTNTNPMHKTKEQTLCEKLYDFSKEYGINMDAFKSELERVEKLEYKNAKALALSYSFIKSGKKDKDLEKTVGEFLDESVTLFDVIRYIRMFKKKN